MLEQNHKKISDPGEAIDEIKYLGESNNGCIFICNDGFYHFHFKNLILKMNKEDFLFFNNIVNECVIEKNGMKTYLGKEILIKCTTVSNIHFGFTRPEFFEVKELFAEAVFMNQVFEITNPKNQNIINE